MILGHPTVSKVSAQTYAYQQRNVYSRALTVTTFRHGVSIPNQGYTLSTGSVIYIAYNGTNKVYTSTRQGAAAYFTGISTTSNNWISTVSISNGNTTYSIFNYNVAYYRNGITLKTLVNVNSTNTNQGYSMTHIYGNGDMGGVVTFGSMKTVLYTYSWAEQNGYKW